MMSDATTSTRGQRALARAVAKPGRSLTTVAILFLLGPTAVLALLGIALRPSVHLFQWMVGAAYALTAAAMMLEAFAAGRRSPAPRRPTTPPSLSVVVAAYLPNEQEIILETLRHVLRALQVPTQRLQIILAYNTPSQLDVEELLAALGRNAAQVMPLKVEGSRSKAENVIAALPHLTGEMTVLLDADHQPAADAPARAWRWLEEGYDIVQGRCIVRNANENWLSRIVAIEFEQMYAVAHQGRSMLADTAIFGGTNGWWRTSALQEIGMDPRMLTEDIESAVRAIQGGYKLVHDRSVISTELATSTAKSWWSQRLRWAQGWLQVTLRHQDRLLRTPHLSGVQRAYWTYMLTWGAIFPILAMGPIAVVLADQVTGETGSWLADPFLLFCTLVTLVSQLVLTVITWRVSGPTARKLTRRWMATYTLLSPLYVTLKNAVALTALLREIAAIDEWVVTARPTRGRTPVEVG
jgi:cellulose synthase/poly-beta-1,6-N-acetylglucosamine synthase-like glycosyltransferase